MIEITIKNGSNLDKEILFALIKAIRQICGSLSLSDVKDKIIRRVSIPVESQYSLPDEFLDFLQESKVDTIIKYDNQELSIQEYIEKMEEENDSYEENDFYEAAVEYKYHLLQRFIKKIIKSIMTIISKDNLLTTNKDDYVKGQFLAYYNIVKQLKEESSVLGIDCEELEKLKIILEKV
jgi:uncharacterized tellurite resistance protein B-like protein